MTSIRFGVYISGMVLGLLFFIIFMPPILTFALLFVGAFFAVAGWMWEGARIERYNQNQHNNSVEYPNNDPLDPSIKTRQQYRNHYRK